MLTETFTIAKTGLAAAFGAPATHRFDVVVHAVNLLQPRALAVVALKCFGLLLDCGGNIDNATQQRRATKNVMAFYRVRIIQVRYAGCWCFAAGCLVVRHGCDE